MRAYGALIVIAILVGALLCLFLGVAISKYRDARRAERAREQEAFEADWGPYSNLWKAAGIVEQITVVKQVQKEVKNAFLGAGKEIEGGLEAALNHPLYLAAAEMQAKLEQELKELI